MADALNDSPTRPSDDERRPLSPPPPRFHADRGFQVMSACMWGFFAVTIPCVAIVIAFRSSADLLDAYHRSPWPSLAVLAFLVGLVTLSIVFFLRSVWLETIQGTIETLQVVPAVDDEDRSSLSLTVAGKRYQFSHVGLATRLKPGMRVTLKVARLPNVIVMLQIDE